MNRTAAKLLLVILALSVTPLNASSALSPAHGVRISPAPIAKALAALPAPLTEAEFFEAVNHTSGPGYAVGAQGSQHMVISISISVPGDLPAIPPPAPGALPLEPGQFAVDSFFGAFTELSIDGAPSTTPQPGGAPPGAPGNTFNDDSLGVEVDLNQRLSGNWLLGGNFSRADAGSFTSSGGGASSGSGASSGAGASSGSGASSSGGANTGGGASSSGGGTSSGSGAASSTGNKGFFDDMLSGDHNIDAKFLRRQDTTLQIVPPGAGAESELINADSISGMHSPIDPLEVCAEEPSTPPCAQVGTVFQTGVNLLETCSSTYSQLCSQMLPLDPPAPEPDTYLLVLDGFGDAAGDGFYSLTISEAALTDCHVASSAAACDELLGLQDALVDLAGTCIGDDTELCEVGLDIPAWLVGEEEPNDDPSEPTGLGTLTETEETLGAGELEEGETADVDWYEFTLEESALVTIETPLSGDALGDAEFTIFELEDFAFCREDPGLPNCAEAGDVFSSVLALLQTCDDEFSALCDSLLSAIEDTPLSGDYYIAVDGFAPEGAYLLDVEILTEYEGCAPGAPGDPGEPVCSEFLDVVDAVYDYNAACTAEPSAACVSGALGMPTDGTELEFLFEVIGDDDGAELETDWYAFTVNEDMLLSGVLTADPPAACEPSLCEFLFTTEMFGICGIEGATDEDLNCAAAGGVISAAGNLVSECAGNDAGVCLDLLSAGDYYVRVEGFPDLGDGAGDYSLTVNVDPSSVAPCGVDPSLAGCSAARDLQGAYQTYVLGCGADPTAACLSSALPGDVSGLEGAADTVVVISGNTVTLHWNSTPYEDDTDDLVLPASWGALGSIAFQVVGDPENPADVGSNTRLGTALAGKCELDPSQEGCSFARDVATKLGALLEVCSTPTDSPCATFTTPVSPATEGGVQLAGPRFSAFDRTFTLTEESSSACDEATAAAGCAEAVSFLDAVDTYRGFCESNPGPTCPSATPPATSAAPAGRSFTVRPGNDPGHFELRETGDSTGIFRVSEEVLYTFDSGNHSYLDAIFSSLPPGSTLVTDSYRIRHSPDGKHFLFYEETGGKRTVYTLDNSSDAPTGTLIPLSANIDDPTRVVLTGSGMRIVIPVPGVPLLTPDDLASTAEEITNAAATGGVAAIATSSGGSSGPVFDLRILNFGKSGGAVEGDVILEPLEGAAADAVRAALVEFMGAVNSVENGPADAYCVEQDKGVPTAGQLFVITNAGKQQEFGFAVAVLDGSRAVEAAGLLNPDSALIAYTHSIRQWAIWTVEKRFDKDKFAQSFVDQTKKTWPTINKQRRDEGLMEVPWTPEIEGAIRSLVDNRWEDIQRIIGASDLPADILAHAPSGARLPLDARLPLLLGGLVAAAVAGARKPRGH